MCPPPPANSTQSTRIPRRSTPVAVPVTAQSVGLARRRAASAASAGRVSGGAAAWWLKRRRLSGHPLRIGWPPAVTCESPNYLAANRHAKWPLSSASIRLDNHVRVHLPSSGGCEVLTASGPGGQIMWRKCAI